MNGRNESSRPPRIDIIHAVLESALDAGATEYVHICGRLLAAERRGWKSMPTEPIGEAMLGAYEDVCGRENAGSLGVDKATKEA